MKKIITYSALLLFSYSVTAQSQFTNAGNFTVHSGVAVSFYGDLVNNGTLIDSGLVMTLAGSSAQKIGGSALTKFKNLTLNNSAGSYLSADESISKELTITAGTFSTTGYNFTLTSDANGTARIAPIQGNFAGNITMQRYLPSGPTDWRFLASPVTGATIADWAHDFYTTGFPGSNNPANSFVSIYTYDETIAGSEDNGYNGVTNTTNPIVPGQGYWCYIGPVPLTFDVTGPPVTFTHTFSVSYTPSSGGAVNDGYVMIGNPYPSAIDWSSAAWTKTNINDAIYIWNSTNQQYASWIGGVSTNGGSNIIGSSQAFWVQTNGLNPVLTSTEDCKVSSNPTFLKTSASSFSAMKLTINGNNFTDETVLQFGSGATKGYDYNLDARKLFSSNTLVPGIATQDTTLIDLSINSMPAVDSAIDIPVKALVGVTGVYSIIADSSSNVFAGYNVVLEDLVTGTKTNLDSTSTYTFTIADTTSAARFVLHIAPLSKNGPLPVNFLYFTAKPQSTIVDINWATASEENDDHYEIERSADGVLFTYLSQVKAYGMGNSTMTQKYSTTDNEPYSGTSYYRLKQVDKNGKYKYTNIAKVNFSKTFSLSVYPNPSNGNVTVLSEQNIDELKVVDMLGQTVYWGTPQAKKVALQLNHEGSYFITVTSGEKISMKRIIVVK